MKYLLFPALLFPLLAKAQPPNDWGAFNKQLDAKPFAGKKFKLEAAVKVHLIDTSAEAEIWVRVDRPDKKTGFFYNMMDKPIRDSNWKVVSISGKIDKDAQYISFGGLYSRRGLFYFDDFKFFVESSNGKMEPVPLSNGDFEADSLTGWGYFQQRSGFYFTTTKTTAYSGQSACMVDGSQFVTPYTFGKNDTAGHKAVINGINLYYEEYGEGEPLLLLHGNSQSVASFSYQIPAFSKHYRVIAVDTRGQGRSGEDGKLYSYDLFAEDMNALLDYLHLDSVNVVGWSDGGNTGLIMAMKYPKKVKRLVTMGANVFIDKTVVDKWVFKELEKQLQEAKGDTSAWTKNRVRLIHLLQTEPRHSFAELKVIQCPVLVVAGEKDIIKENHTKSIAANIPNGTLLIAPKQTHYFPQENPVTFNKAVLDFLGK